VHPNQKILQLETHPVKEAPQRYPAACS
jgi:hypothetical protein